jgi:hypothetical protein
MTTTTDSPTWEEQVARLSERQTPDIEVIIPDDETELAVAQSFVALTDARMRARKRLSGVDDPAADLDHLAALVEADDAVVAAREANKAAVDAADAASIRFLFRKLPTHVYEAVQYEHPATTEQEERRYRYNPETYVPALLAACSVHPLTYRAAFELVHGSPVTPVDDDHPNVFALDVERHPAPLTQGEVAMLFAAARDVNERVGLTMGKGWRSTTS